MTDKVTPDCNNDTRPGLILHDGKFTRTFCTIVKNTYDYFIKEEQSAGFLIDPAKLEERTGLAIGKSKHSVHKILKDKKSTYKFLTPRPLKSRKKAIENLPVLSRNLIRQKIYQFYREGRRINADDLCKEMCADGVMESKSISTISRILRDVGFISRGYAGRRLLIEKNSVIIKRCRFFKSTVDLIYDDVTWIGETCIKPPAKTIQGTPYLIILQIAGNSKGFVKTTTCLSLNTPLDTKKQISPESFKKWLDKLLEITPSGSNIILNSSYSHNNVAEKVPNIYSDKKTIKNWLKKYKVPFDEKLTKPELLDLVKLSKPVIPTYALDSYVADKGFNLIRVPPHHEHFNAAEHIIETINNKVDKLKFEHDSPHYSNKVFEEMILNSVNTITTEDWDDAVKQAEELIEYARNYERTLEDSIQNFIQCINNQKKSGREDLISNSLFYKDSDSDLTEASEDSDNCAEETTENSVE